MDYKVQILVVFGDLTAVGGTSVAPIRHEEWGSGMNFQALLIFSVVLETLKLSKILYLYFVEKAILVDFWNLYYF